MLRIFKKRSKKPEDISSVDSGTLEEQITKIVVYKIKELDKRAVSFLSSEIEDHVKTILDCPELIEIFENCNYDLKKKIVHDVIRLVPAYSIVALYNAFILTGLSHDQFATLDTEKKPSEWILRDLYPDDDVQTDAFARTAYKFADYNNERWSVYVHFQNFLFVSILRLIYGEETVISGINQWIEASAPKSIYLFGNILEQRDEFAGLPMSWAIEMIKTNNI